MATNSVQDKDCHCDMCKCSLRGMNRYDAATRIGSWAVMCFDCWFVYGVGLGLGLGQIFDPNGRCIGGNTSRPSRPDGGEPQ